LKADSGILAGRSGSAWHWTSANPPISIHDQAAVRALIEARISHMDYSSGQVFAGERKRHDR
jgi:hypothetical protein